MTVEELYQELTGEGKELCHPFDYSTLSVDYLDYVEELFSRYLTLLEQLDNEDTQRLNRCLEGRELAFPLSRSLDLKRDARLIAGVVRKVLKKSYMCYHEEAYYYLSRFFGANNHHYFLLLPQIVLNGNRLYRMRNSLITENVDGQMFHIPFNLRYKVDTRRYSIPGYPVLYLAGSLMTAWYELDQPDPYLLTYVGMEFKNQVSFIDLGYPGKRPNLWEYYCLFAFYPLMMACSVRVKYPAAPFKPEYMLPQLLLKVIRSCDYRYVAGISYLSNKAESVNLQGLSSRNFVVTTYNTLCRKGYDTSLADMMRMSEARYINKKQLERYWGDGEHTRLDILNTASLAEKGMDMHDLSLTCEY